MSGGTEAPSFSRGTVQLPPQAAFPEPCFPRVAGDRVTCPVHGKGAWDEAVFSECHTQIGG